MKYKLWSEIAVIAEKYNRKYRQIEERWLKAMSVEHLLNCEKGCAHCCTQLPIGTLVSGVLIGNYLMQRSMFQEYKAVIDQGVQQSALLQTEGERAPDVWWEKRINCALLKDNLCSVYPYRPPSCSAFYVRDGKKLCPTAKSNTLMPMLNNSPVMAVSIELDVMFLEEVLGHKGIPPMMGPLGTIIRAGTKLLASRESFEQYVAECSGVDSAEIFAGR